MQCGKHEFCMARFANYLLNYWMHEYHEYAVMPTILPSFQALRRSYGLNNNWMSSFFSKRAEFFNSSFQCNERHSCGSDRCTHHVLWSVPPPNILDFKADGTKQWIFSLAFDQSFWQEQSLGHCFWHKAQTIVLNRHCRAEEYPWISLDIQYNSCSIRG